MTHLPEKAIKEFKEIYKSEYGVKLNDIEAAKKAGLVMNLFKTLVKPLKNGSSNIVRSVELTKTKD